MKFSRVLIAITAMSIFLAGCGGGDSGSSATASTVSTDAAKQTTLAVVQPTVTIMPLGDSITYGSDGTNTQGGFRPALLTGLQNDGAKIDFVGSQSDGPASLSDKNHEGHPGWRIAGIGGSINGWLDTHKPQVIALMIGTNDIVFNDDLANAPKRLGVLIDQITTKLPNSRLLVASITPLGNTGLNDKVKAYNAAIPGIVQQKAAAGKRVTFVDMNSALLASDLYDGTHPNPAGYAKMAARWRTALQPYVQVIDPVANAREQAAMDKLLVGFDVKWNDWTKGPSMEAIINIYERTRDPKYLTLLEQSLEYGRGWRSGVVGHQFFYDDMGWYANAWLRAYDVTGDARFLTEAKAIFSDFSKAWDNTCGGGVWWNDDRNYKNAITNELFLLTAARLARRAPNGTGAGSYQDWALKQADWFVNKSKMINADNLINDGLTSACQNNGQTTWAYNQGVILSALTEMYYLTGDRGYLFNAEKIAEAATTRMVYANGVLRDACDASASGCTGDAIMFKGPFVQGLARLYNADRNNKPAYFEFLKRSADSIWNTSRNAQNGLGVKWNGPVGTPTQSSQGSGLLLLGSVALLQAGGEFNGPFKATVSGLNVSDTANAGAWSVQQNLQVNNVFYGDRTYTFAAIPGEVVGATWIRTANASKAFTGTPIVTFALSASADVYVAFDNRSARPAWADASWTDTGLDLTQAESATVSRGFSLFKKHFNAGNVALGPWNNGGASMYTVIVK
jgi:predicted alpha-1,6-mannanase (GH76 family)/lysophospholipase L1-like esterase